MTQNKVYDQMAENANYRSVMQRSRIKEYMFPVQVSLLTPIGRELTRKRAISKTSTSVVVLVNGTRAATVNKTHPVSTQFPVQRLCRHGNRASKTGEIEEDEALPHRIERAALVKITPIRMAGVVGRIRAVDLTLRTATTAISVPVLIRLTRIITGDVRAVLRRGLARGEGAAIRTAMTAVAASLVPILGVGEVGLVRIVAEADSIRIRRIVAVRGVTVGHGRDQRVARTEDTAGAGLTTRTDIALARSEPRKLR